MPNADEQVFLWLNGLVGRFEPLDRAAGWVVSDYLVPVSLALALIGMWFVGRDQLTRQRHQIGVFAALTSMGLSSLAVFIVNAVYFRDRPFVDHDVAMLFYQPTDSSFPSNAVAATFGISAAVWGVNRRLGTVLLVGSAIHGVSRVYAGVHYPLDILAGAMIGIAVAFLTFRIRDFLEPILVRVIRAARALCLA
jgi:undecaprenyl-diphosphatase